MDDAVASLAFPAPRLRHGLRGVEFCENQAPLDLNARVLCTLVRHRLSSGTRTVLCTRNALNVSAMFAHSSPSARCLAWCRITSSCVKRKHLPQVAQSYAVRLPRALVGASASTVSKSSDPTFCWGRAISAPFCYVLVSNKSDTNLQYGTLTPCNTLHGGFTQRCVGTATKACVGKTRILLCVLAVFTPQLPDQLPSPLVARRCLGAPRPGTAFRAAVAGRACGARVAPRGGSPCARTRRRCRSTGAARL